MDGKWFVIAAVILMPACGRPSGDLKAAQVDRLFAAWNRADAPGCAVGISQNGTVVYEHGYGMANLKRGVPITPETVFPIASISKSFTAMSVVLAAERGQLSLDDEVQKFIPEWVDREDHVTVRNLLNHTSGLRDAFTLLGWAWSNEVAKDQNKAIVKMLARQRGLNFVPGTKFEYNNGGYVLLANILKLATGQSLQAFTDANIFKPLGMTRSYFREDSKTLVPDRATGYQKFADGWHEVPENGSGVVGNGGMESTIGDLLRWAQNFDDARVGTPQMLAAMQKATVLTDGTTSTYGFGLGIGEYRGAVTVEHSGGDHGMATKIVRFPKQRFAVAVLCNEDSIVMGGMSRVNPDVFTNGIADIYLGSVLAPAEASPTTAPQATPVTASPDADLSGKTGLYRFVLMDWPMQISSGRGVLLFRSYYQDDSDFELRPLGGNRFLFNGNVPFEFLPATAGSLKEWRSGPPGGDQGVFQEVTFVPPASELPQYAGEYHSDELGVTFTIKSHDPGLVVRNHLGAETSLQGFSRDVFAGDLYGIVKFERASHGTVTGFTVNRGAARDLRFDRVKPH
jgi:CubicO group peptidase (beta-lactamase class C family)